MELNLADLFESLVDVIPERLAAVCGDRRLTYRALDERANRLANALAARGVGAGDHVGLYLYNCAEFLEAILAAFKLRAVPINVNYRYVEDELALLAEERRLQGRALQRRAGPAGRRGEGLRAHAAARRLGRRSRSERGQRRVRAAPRLGLARAALRPAIRRRPLRHLHRRHDGHAPRRDVAARGRVLRGPAGRQPRRRAARRRGGAGPRGPRAGRRDRHPRRRALHPRRGAVGRVDRVLHRRQRDHRPWQELRRQGHLPARRGGEGEHHHHGGRRHGAAARRRRSPRAPAPAPRRTCPR